MHWHEHKMKKSFACAQCDYKATEKNNLQRHIKSVHERQTFACTQCDYKAKWKSHLQTHIKSKHEGQPFQCTNCHFTTKWKSLLRKHTKSAHNPEEYFEADIKIKKEFKNENHEGDDTKSMKQEECDDNTVVLKSNIHVKSEKVSMIAANIKEEYFEDDIKPNVASL